MDFQPSRASWRVLVLAACAMSLTACSALSQQSPRPVVEQVNTPAAASTASVTPPQTASDAVDQGGNADAQSNNTQTVTTTADDLRQLINDRKVSELRTSYNGTYGASLLFKPEDLTYYVALFQGRSFWRVIRTNSQSQAESLYKAFVAESADLASVDIRRIQLEAEYAFMQKQLADRNQALGTLRADAALRQEQEQRIAAAQAQAHQQASELAKQRRSTSDELDALQRQIDALRAQQDKVGNNKWLQQSNSKSAQ